MLKPRVKKTGRPRKDEERIPYGEVDRLLVEGEDVVGDDGVAVRRWPTMREIARRYGCAPSVISEYATSHDAKGRRARHAARQQLGEAMAQAINARTPSDESEVSGDTTDEGLDGSEEPAGLDPFETASTADGSPLVPGSSEAARTKGEPHRPRGRPVKGTGPLIAYEELDRMLVHGELVQLPDGKQTVVYPNHGDLSEYFGVSKSLIDQYARAHNCDRRRREARARLTAKTDEKLIQLRADALAVSKDDAIRMIDSYLLNFAQALKDERVRFDNPSDFNTMLRLKEFVQGNADSRSEVHTSLTLEDIQSRHARWLREGRETAPAEAGVIDVTIISDAEGGSPEDDAGADATVAGLMQPDSPSHDALSEPSAPPPSAETEQAVLVRISREANEENTHEPA